MKLNKIYSKPELDVIMVQNSDILKVSGGAIDVTGGNFETYNIWGDIQ